MISIVLISKDERTLDETISGVRCQTSRLDEPCEIIVVDASGGRLDDIRRHHAEVLWIPFTQPPGVSITIPHQRNVGVRAAHGEIVVFTDAGCTQADGWLEHLVAPLYHGENVTAGVILAAGGSLGLYGVRAQQVQAARFLSECPTGNMAFRRGAFDAVSGFDETFAFGSDIDFSWRLIDAGYRIRSVPDAVIEHDFGTWRRQLRRSYVYGRARARLYGKHRDRMRRILRTDPMTVVYPLFLLGLPLTLILPYYPALLLIPAWRNRSQRPTRVITDHLAYGAGVLTELASR